VKTNTINKTIGTTKIIPKTRRVEEHLFFELGRLVVSSQNSGVSVSRGASCWNYGFSGKLLSYGIYCQYG
jgi:hypothetical protein